MVTAPAPPRPARRRRLAPAATGVIVTLAVMLGVGIGHEAWRAGSGPTAGFATAGDGSGSASAGSGGSNVGSGTGVGPDGVYGYYYGGSGGGRAGGGSSAAGGGSGAAGGGAAPNGTAQSTAISAKVAPALVDINSTFYQGAQGAGTGIVLTADGEILTNNHVVNGATSISVTDIGNGKTYKGTVAGYDKSKDIAVVKLQGASGLQTAKLGDSSTTKVGDAVVAIGNAGGSGSTPTSAAGQVTKLDQSITAGDELDRTTEQLSGLIQVDADVQAGDSGGSLVNSAGEVIGVDTAASAGFSFAASAASEGFAVPINQAMTIVRQIESGQGTTTVHVGPTAFLGVLLSASPQGGYGGAPATTAGAPLADVTNGGAAQKAGLAGGDVITSLNGQTIDSADALSKVIQSLTPGTAIPLGWVDSGGQSHTATVTLGSGPPA